MIWWRWRWWWRLQLKQAPKWRYNTYIYSVVFLWHECMEKCKQDREYREENWENVMQNEEPFEWADSIDFDDILKLNTLVTRKTHTQSCVHTQNKKKTYIYKNCCCHFCCCCCLLFHFASLSLLSYRFGFSHLTLKNSDATILHSRFLSLHFISLHTQTHARSTHKMLFDSLIPKLSLSLGLRNFTIWWRNIRVSPTNAIRLVSLSLDLNSAFYFILAFLIFDGILCIYRVLQQKITQNSSITNLRKCLCVENTIWWHLDCNPFFIIYIF